MKNQYKYLCLLGSALLLASCTTDSDDNIDSDGDGMIDKYDACPFDPQKFVDEGQCGCGNEERIVNGIVRCLYQVDGDSDQDGVVDTEDHCPDKPFKFQPGFCGCERYDLDADGDGAIDSCEPLPGDDPDNPYTPEGLPDQCPGNASKILRGTCGCDVEEIDKDQDGYTDACGEGGPQNPIFPDQCPTDRYKHAPGICDCGTPDSDPDNDGVPDCIDLCPSDPDKTIPGLCGCGKPDTDTDNDGTPDCLDRCPNDPEKTHPGFCKCGESEVLDSDNDGYIDCFDKCPNDPNKHNGPGVCGCGVPDADLNENGTLDCLEPCAEGTPMAGQIPGVCGCDAPDIDSDNDDVLDCLDVCPDDPNKSKEEGICGCGYDDTLDTDKDGTLDCIDACPNDPMKADDKGQCGCGNDETDTDGDGTADCVDECPDDPTQTTVGVCGCGLHPIVETSTGEDGTETTTTVCPAEGGLLSLDNMFPGNSPNEDDTLDGIMQRYLNRTTPNHTLKAYFIPGGNALVDPYILLDQRYWTLIEGDSLAYALQTRLSSFYDEYMGPRPFPQYPCFLGSNGYSGGNGYAGQRVNNPYYGIQDVKVRFGLLGGTATKTGGSDYMHINSNSQVRCDPYDFTFTTATQTISMDSTDFEAKFFSHGGTTVNDGSNAHGAAIQGFQVFFGDPQVRFSLDGENWTEWMTDNNNMWRTELEMPEGYGYRYAYMQTRNATLPPVAEGEKPASNVTANYIYYETSNRIMIKEPHKDAHIQIATFRPTTTLTTQESLDEAMTARIVRNRSVTLYYMPGNNLLDDPTFADTSADKWVLTNAQSTLELEAYASRTFAALPELVMGPNRSVATQRYLLPEKYRDEACQASFWISDVPSSFLAEIIMYDEDGIILDYGTKKISDTNTSNYYSLTTSFLDETASFRITLSSDSPSLVPRIQTVRVAPGEAYIRFSNDRKTWSRWEPATGAKYSWQLDHCIPTEDDTGNELCTVTMQTFDLVTREFSEASATILYHN